MTVVQYMKNLIHLNLKRGEPIVAYIWIGWDWGITSWGSRHQFGHWSFYRNSFKHTSNYQRKTERCQHVIGCTWKHHDLDILCLMISPDTDVNILDHTTYSGLQIMLNVQHKVHVTCKSHWTCTDWIAHFFFAKIIVRRYVSHIFDTSNKKWRQENGQTWIYFKNCLFGGHILK